MQNNLGVALLLVLVPLTGCGPDSGGPATIPGASDVKPTKRVAVIPIVSSANGSAPPHLTSDDARWRSEHYSQRVAVFLDQLNAYLLTASRSKDELRFVADSVTVSACDRSELAEVHQDSAVTVRRWINARSPADPPPAATGKDSLRDAMLPRSAELNSGGQSNTGHGKFKIVSVDLKASRIDTRVLWQVSISEVGGNRQETSYWDCQWSLSSEDQITLTKMTLVSLEEVVTSDSKRSFWDVTASLASKVPDFVRQFGPSADYWYDRLENRFSILPTGYQGIAVADVNGDGLEDVYVSQPGGVVLGLPNRLFLQQPDGTIVDASASSGLDWLLETHSALFVDFDNDGDQDVAVATSMGVVFCENDGSGRFEKRTVKLTPDAAPMSLAAADFDHDQDLDLYVCCYSLRGSSPLMGTPIPYHDANNGGRNLMLRNDRDWRFRDVTVSVGMNQNNRRFSFAAAWEDFDNDGDLDVYVANDYGRNNLFRNNGGQFEDVASDFGVEDISAGMSAAWGDYDADGWMDLYISNMWSSAGRRIAYQRQFKEHADRRTLAQYQRHARGNSLFSNLLGSGRNQFSDDSVAAGVTMGRWAWCSCFADINNDGHEDVLVANGFITQEKYDDL